MNRNWKKLPTDTLLDGEMPDGQGMLSFNAATAMKILYLAFPPIAELQAKNGWLDRETIDYCEGLRRKGCIEIIQTKEGFRIQPTPIGAAAAWLEKHK